MTWINISSIRRNKTKTAFYLSVFVLFVVSIIYFSEVFAMLLLSPEDVRDWVLSYGTLAPLVFFLLQIAQVIIAPLNNFVINFAGGYLFGPVFGFVLNYTGWITGAIVTFWLSRTFGRKFVNFFISEKKLCEFDALAEKGAYIFFMLFLLPGPPDDFLVYFIGLSCSIKFKTFLWMVLIGKIPGTVATSFLGAGVAEHNFFSVGIYAVFIFSAVIVFWKKPELWQIWKKK